MRFNRGFWTHENFKDVAIEVIKVQYQDQKKARLKIMWWNKNPFGKPFPLLEQRIELRTMEGWTKIGIGL